jgi:hypothetical protein
MTLQGTLAQIHHRQRRRLKTLPCSRPDADDAHSHLVDALGPKRILTGAVQANRVTDLPGNHLNCFYIAVYRNDFRPAHGNCSRELLPEPAQSYERSLQA